MKEILTSKEYSKLDIYLPLIIPHHFLEIFKKEIGKRKIKALEDGKICFVECWWCAVSKMLPTSTK